MRAARRTRYGSPGVIRVEEIPIPEPGDAELLIRVHAATVSRTDCALLTARPFIMRFLAGLRRPRITTLGTDFTGTVATVGPRVTRFRAGDRVWGINDLGVRSQAQYCVVAETDASSMPDGVSFEDAVACIEGGWYAQSFIERVRLKRGTDILINGATGAIGSALLQLCTDLGATVTAVGNTKNVELLRSLGATRVIDYEREDFTRDGGTFDCVFDAVGKSTFGACKRLLRPGGVYLSSEFGPGLQNAFLALVTPALRRKKVVFPFPIDRKRYLELARPLVAEHRLRPVIDRRYPLNAVADAYAYVASGQKTGSVVLNLWEESDAPATGGPA